VVLVQDILQLTVLKVFSNKQREKQMGHFSPFLKRDKYANVKIGHKRFGISFHNNIYFL